MNNTSEEPVVKEEASPQKSISREEAYRRINEMIAELEYRHQESVLGRLSRNKSFWYGVFGTIFFVFMGALLYWVYLDITG